MTLKKYLKILEVLESFSSTGDLNDVSFEDDISKSILLVSAWYEMSIDDVRRLSLDEFRNLVQKIDLKELELDSNAKLPYYIYVSGQKYMVLQTFAEMSFGQFVDMQIALKDLYKEDGKIDWKNVPKVISCFIQDENKKYVPGVDVGEMDIKDVYGILVFFCKFRKQLENLTKAYLNRGVRGGLKIKIPIKSPLN
ncbi:MAG: hypothetical protein QXF76_02730 [Candidatus Anstonellales archaeon]